MKKVIVTLTTVPNRLNSIHSHGGLKKSLEFLMNMTYPNYEIHLNLPYINKKTNEPYEIPEWILNVRDSKLKIFRTEDYGSLTKILPTIKRLDENDESIIITVDDDLQYMDGFIEYHLLKRELYPDCAIGFAGITAIDGSCHFCTTVQKDVRVKILEGYKTVSYLRSFFKEDFESEFINESWSDDIIISAYLGKHEIHKIVVNYDGDQEFSPRVESFPVVGHLPNERGGCWWYRKDSETDNADKWYKLNYLER